MGPLGPLETPSFDSRGCGSGLMQSSQMGQPVGVFLGTAEEVVAAAAEQSADYSRVMVVVYRQAPGPLTDGTLIALAGAHLLELSDGDFLGGTPGRKVLGGRGHDLILAEMRTS